MVSATSPLVLQEAVKEAFEASGVQASTIGDTKLGDAGEKAPPVNGDVVAAEAPVTEAPVSDADRKVAEEAAKKAKEEESAEALNKDGLDKWRLKEEILKSVEGKDLTTMSMKTLRRDLEMRLTMQDGHMDTHGDVIKELATPIIMERLAFVAPFKWVGTWIITFPNGSKSKTKVKEDGSFEQLGKRCQLRAKDASSISFKWADGTKQSTDDIKDNTVRWTTNPKGLVIVWNRDLKADAEEEAKKKAKVASDAEAAVSLKRAQESQARADRRSADAKAKADKKAAEEKRRADKAVAKKAEKAALRAKEEEEKKVKEDANRALNLPADSTQRRLDLIESAEAQRKAAKESRKREKEDQHAWFANLNTGNVMLAVYGGVKGREGVVPQMYLDMDPYMNLEHVMVSWINKWLKPTVKIRDVPAEAACSTEVGGKSLDIGQRLKDMKRKMQVKDGRYRLFIRWPEVKIEIPEIAKKPADTPAPSPPPSSKKRERRHVEGSPRTEGKDRTDKTPKKAKSAEVDESAQKEHKPLGDVDDIPLLSFAAAATKSVDAISALSFAAAANDPVDRLDGPPVAVDRVVTVIDEESPSKKARTENAEEEVVQVIEAKVVAMETGAE